MAGPVDFAARLWWRVQHRCHTGQTGAGQTYPAAAGTW